MHQPLTLGNFARLGLFATLGAGCLFSFAVGLEIGWEAGLLCLTATAALAATSLALALRRGGEIYEPLWFVVLIVAVGITGKAFYICLGPSTRVEFLLLDKEPRDLLFAALISAVGMLCLSLGYLLGRVRWRLPWLDRLSADGWHRSRLIAVVGALLIVGLLSFVIFAARLDVPFESLRDLSAKRGTRLPSGDVVISGGYMRWGALLIEIALYLGFAEWVARRRGLRSYRGAAIILLALLAIAFPIFVSSRQTVMLVIIRVILIWTCIRGEPRIRYVLTLMLAGLVVIGSMLALRRGRTELPEISSHLGWSEMLEVTVGGRHFLDLSKTAHVIEAVPETVDYQYGRTLVTWLVAPVPRSLWPDKPSISIGRDLGVPVFKREIGTGGVPPGIIGELHLNFGLAGVFVGLFVLGVALRSLWVTLRPGFPSKGVVLVYTVLSTRLTLDLMAGSFSGSLTKLLQEMIPLGVALWAVSARPRGGEEDAASG